MNFETLKTQEQDALMHTYARFDVALDHGKGALVYDIDGREYLDLTSGIGVNCLGHQDADLVAAITDQAGKLLQASNLFYTRPMVEAGTRLKKLSGMEKVFFANSGAEANEGMIKIARKYSWDHYHDPERMRIMTLTQSFHGRTIATLEATGQDKFHQNFFPFTDGFVHTPANDFDAFVQAMDDSVCGVMMELVQGESGVRPLDPDFVKAVADYCKEHDVLLMIDEVQTGIGRTGAMFTYQQYGLEPDLASCAKGLGGGVPVGAVLAGLKTADVLGPGDHGTTFGGNPLAARAAVVVLDKVGNPEFLAEVLRKGEYFQNQLKAMNLPHVKDVRGLGLMIGIEVGPDAIAQDLAALRQKGILALKAGTGTIRLLPPLIISDEQLDAALAAMKEVFA